MDNENKTTGTDWLDEMLGTQNTPKELGVDEVAVAAAGLTRPEDMELEQIIRETQSEEWKDIPLAETIKLPKIEPDLQDTIVPIATASEPLTPAPEVSAPEVSAPEVSAPEAPVVEEASTPVSSDTQQILLSCKEAVAEPAEEAAPEALASNQASENTSAAEKPAPQRRSTPRRSPASLRKPATRDIQVQETTAAGESKFTAWCKDYWNRLRNPAKKKDNLFGIPHIISSFIWLAVIIGIGASVGRMGWLCAKDVLALGKTPQELVFVIDETDDISTVAQRLKNLGLIEYPELFKLFARITNKGDNLQVGTITFDGDIVYDYNALCNAMTYKKTTKATVEVVIPEGYSCAQIFDLLEEKGVCTVRELEAYAANGELNDYWFLEDVERGHKYCLEGFLFPDTYEFYVGDSAERVLEKFLNDFNYRFSDRLKEKYENLNKDLKLNLSIREVVIMASIIEKEKANHLEGYTISSVFYNRLTHSASYPFLNSDATLLYDVEYYTGGNMTNEQRANSPYNTYTRKGLPIGPIANPGMGSIDAALSPETTDYYYFVFDKKAGQHQFSKTLAEHQKKVKELGL